MKIGVLGTGMVGQAIAGRLAELGHDVMVGTRDVAATLAKTEPGMMGNPPFSLWQQDHKQVKLGTFAEAAAHGELLFNCTSGHVALDALKLADAANLNHKVLIDISNPLDFSRGMPPSLFVCNTDSLGEQIQRAFPQARVVKALNTVNAQVMIHPEMVAGGDHSIFLCGNDARAKAQVEQILHSFGWRDILDLGDITGARGMEMMMPTWLALMGVLQTPAFNYKVVRGVTSRSRFPSGRNRLLDV